MTYLGTNGYQFEFGRHALLVDPYFSRVDLLSIALGSRLQPDMPRVAEGMRHLAPKAEAILVTHGHFDHLLDVPTIMSRTHARLIASASAVHLAKSVGASSGDAVTPGDVRQIGPWKIRVLPATHDRLFGKVPFDQPETHGSGPPQHPADWICGEPLAFLIEVGGQRIYIDSGGTPALLRPMSAPILQFWAWHYQIHGRDCPVRSNVCSHGMFCRVTRTISFGRWTLDFNSGRLRISRGYVTIANKQIAAT